MAGCSRATGGLPEDEAPAVWLLRGEENEDGEVVDAWVERVLRNARPCKRLRRADESSQYDLPDDKQLLWIEEHAVRPTIFGDDET